MTIYLSEAMLFLLVFLIGVIVGMVGLMALATYQAVKKNRANR